MLDDSLWYVAYGSNLSSARLQRYLDTIDPVAPPLDSRPMTLAHRLFFAHESSLWTGGSAFVDPGFDPDVETLAMAWLVRPDQFVGILARENGRTELPERFDPVGLPPGVTTTADHRRYGLVVGCELPDGRPALTFTTPDDPLPAPLAPSARYVDVIVAGLIEGHGLTDASARDYLARRIT